MSPRMCVIREELHTRIKDGAYEIQRFSRQARILRKKEIFAGLLESTKKNGGSNAFFPKETSTY